MTVEQAVRTGDLGATAQALGIGPDVDRRTPDGFTPLMIAAGLGQPQMVELLLTAGADVFAIDARMDASALHKAAQSGNPDVARLLLDRGAFVDQQSPTIGHTALMDAVWHKHEAVVRLLLERGAKTTLRSHYGQRARDFAERDGLAAIAAMIEARDRADAEIAEAQAVMAAVKAGDAAEVRRLLGEGATADERAPMRGTFDDGYTPLGVAARDGHADIVRLLLAAGADPRRVDGLMKATPGHKAGYMGHPDVVAALTHRDAAVEAGKPSLEINAQGPYNGFTALHDAVWHGHLEAARVLMAAGARLDLRSHAGLTPRGLAELYGYGELAEMLALAEAERAEGTPRSA